MSYVEINEPFNTKYDTYIIGYCVDTNEWFITDERHWFFQFDEEFDTYENAYQWFVDNVQIISDKQVEILKSCGQKPIKQVVLVD